MVFHPNSVDASAHGDGARHYAPNDSIQIRRLKLYNRARFGCRSGLPSRTGPARQAGPAAESGTLIRDRPRKPGKPCLLSMTAVEYTGRRWSGGMADASDLGRSEHPRGKLLG